MKKGILMLTLLLAAFVNYSQVRMPQPSPTQMIRQDFGMGNIELTYSRPAAKGRKIFGDLVPFDKIWRTGANGATLIKFNQPVQIMNKAVDTGSYALYTIPGAENWTIILNKGVKNWGTAGYSESDDVIKISIPRSRLKNYVENFTMGFANLKPESCELQMMWEKTAVSIPITTNIKSKLKADLDNALKGDKKPYWQATQFYNEYEKNLPLALEYANKATDENPKAYWVWLYKAKIQQEMGDKAGATTSANKSMELATEDKNDDYVKMNKELLKKLK